MPGGTPLLFFCFVQYIAPVCSPDPTSFLFPSRFLLLLPDLVVSRFIFLPDYRAAFLDRGPICIAPRVSRIAPCAMWGPYPEPGRISRENWTRSIHHRAASCRLASWPGGMASDPGRVGLLATGTSVDFAIGWLSGLGQP